MLNNIGLPGLIFLSPGGFAGPVVLFATLVPVPPFLFAAIVAVLV